MKSQKSIYCILSTSAFFLLVLLFDLTISVEQVASQDQVLSLTSTIPSKRIYLSFNDRQRVRAITQPTRDFSRAEKFEAMQGGASTSYKFINQNSFSHSSANLTFERRRKNLN